MIDRGIKEPFRRIPLTEKQRLCCFSRNSDFGDFFAERFEIGIVHGHQFELGAVAGLESFLEPFPGDFGFAELAGIAGEVIGDERHLREFIAYGKQYFPGGLDAAAGRAPGGVGKVKPAGSFMGSLCDDRACDIFGKVPLGLFGGDFPAEFEDDGMVALGG